MPGDEKFFGKYRGTVLQNVDPQQLARLQVQVTDVTQALPGTWATPCLPFTGTQSGMFVIPAIGSGVWVEFEHGDPNYPIWSGGWYSSQSDLPTAASTATPGVQCFVVQTMLSNQLMISDTPGPTGGIVLQIVSGAKITINETGITIDNGQGASISLQGPTVSINGSAMTIT